MSTVQWEEYVGTILHKCDRVWYWTEFTQLEHIYLTSFSKVSVDLAAQVGKIGVQCMSFSLIMS